MATNAHLTVSTFVLMKVRIISLLYEKKLFALNYIQ